MISDPCILIVFKIGLDIRKNIPKQDSNSNREARGVKRSDIVIYCRALDFEP